MGVRRASTLLAALVVVLLSLFVMDEANSDRLGKVRRFVGEPPRSDVHLSGQTSTPRIRLYIAPDSSPEPPDDGRREGNSKYPEIFASNAVIVILGADWCQWCKEEAKELTGPSHEYNIFYANIDEERWSSFMDEKQLGSSVPVTLLIERGEIVHTWNGYVPWTDILPLAGKAKKSGDEQKEGFIIGPLDGGDGERLDLDQHQRNKRRR